MSYQELVAYPMILPLPTHRQPPAQDLFCRTAGIWDKRPAVSMKVRDSFLANFSANFAAAMVEHYADIKERLVLSRV